jgi:hypothetical protein
MAGTGDRPHSSRGRPRRKRRERYDVVYLPPPWRRALTESGMRRRTTRADVVVIALFFVALVALIAWLLAHSATTGG